MKRFLSGFHRPKGRPAPQQTATPAAVDPLNEALYIINYWFKRDWGQAEKQLMDSFFKDLNDSKDTDIKKLYKKITRTLLSWPYIIFSDDPSNALKEMIKGRLKEVKAKNPDKYNALIDRVVEDWIEHHNLVSQQAPLLPFKMARDGLRILNDENAMAAEKRAAVMALQALVEQQFGDPDEIITEVIPGTYALQDYTKVRPRGIPKRQDLFQCMARQIGLEMLKINPEDQFFKDNILAAINRLSQALRYTLVNPSEKKCVMIYLE